MSETQTLIDIARTHVVRASVDENQSDSRLSRRPPLTIEVAGGRHRGATSRIRAGRFTVGRNVGCDVILTDDSIADRHIEVRRLNARIGSMVSIKALSDDVRVGIHELVAGSEIQTTLPARVSLGGTHIILRSQESGETSNWLLIALPLAILIGGLAGYLLPNMRLLPSTFGGSQVRPSIEQSLAENSAETNIPPAITNAIRGAGLQGKVRAVSRGSVIVYRGTLSERDYATWRQVRDDIKASGTAGQVFDLVTLSAAMTPSPGLVSSVMLRPTPLVVSSDGRTARIGETLRDGWRVKAITADRVVLQRGKQEITVSH